MFIPVICFRECVTCDARGVAIAAFKNPKRYVDSD